MYDLWKQNRELCEQPSASRARSPSIARRSSGATAGLLERELGNVDLFSRPAGRRSTQHRARGFRRHDAPPPVLPAARRGLRRRPPRPRATRPGRPYFLFVGRLERLKGVQTLDRGVPRLRRGGPPDRAGDGTLRRRAPTAGRTRPTSASWGAPYGRARPASTAARSPCSCRRSATRRSASRRRGLRGAHPRDRARPRRRAGSRARAAAASLTARTASRSRRWSRQVETRVSARRLASAETRAYRERWSPDAHLRAYFEAID